MGRRLVIPHRRGFARLVNSYGRPGDVDNDVLSIEGEDSYGEVSEASIRGIGRSGVLSGQDTPA